MKKIIACVLFVFLASSCVGVPYRDPSGASVRAEAIITQNGVQSHVLVTLEPERTNGEAELSVLLLGESPISGRRVFSSGGVRRAEMGELCVDARELSVLIEAASLISRGGEVADSGIGRDGHPFVRFADGRVAVLSQDGTPTEIFSGSTHIKIVWAEYNF